MVNTKKSLIFSALSLILCCALLIGTTFAWFTDSVTNTGNIITAGNLSIDAIAYDLDMANVSGTGYQIDGVNNDRPFYFEAEGQSLKAKDCPPIINDKLWEPGKSNAKLLEVKNTGSLAAKIKLAFDVQSTGLMNALWFDFIQVSTDGNITGSFEKRPMSQIETIANGLEFKLAANGGTIRFILVYGMYEEAGNEYKGKWFKADVTVIAAQDTVESDGFGNSDYDAGATYPVASNDDLEQALTTAEAGDTILLSTGKFTLPEDVGIPEGVTIAGNGVEETKITVPTTESGNTVMGLIIDKPGVTIKNATISPALGISNSNYAGVIVVKEGDTVLDNVVITTDNSASPVLVTGSSFGEGDTLTISNSKISSDVRSLYIVDSTNGKVIIDNCDITGIYTFSVNSSNSQNLEIEVRDSALHGWTSYGHIKSVSFTNTEFSQGNSDYNFLRPYTNTTWTDCTFGDGFKIGAGATGLTYTFTNCEYADRTAVTAENIKDKLLDPTGDDVKVLNCVITVDGEAAELQ